MNSRSDHEETATKPSDPQQAAQASARSHAPNAGMLQHLARFAWPLAAVAIAAMAFTYLRERPPTTASTSEIVVPHATPSIVHELRQVSRLETAVLHVEKVVDIKDRQTRLYGLVPAEDTLLFVATGEVTLGVDLGKLGDDDVRFEPTTKTAYVNLPEPEVLSSRFDELHSYVHSRSTDMLAKRNEGLEGAARREAIAAFNATGNDARSRDRAKEQAEKQIRSLAKAWGANEVVVTWKAGGAAPKGEVGVEH